MNRKIVSTLCAFALLTAFAPLPLHAQQQIRMDGRMFDSNTQLGGSGRINDQRIFSPLSYGNLTATGNIRGGQSLRSFSPISDPTSFRGYLGSSTLSTFSRDSISTADVTSYGGAPQQLQTYYDPSRVAPTGNYLSGSSAYQNLARPFISDPRFARPGSQSYGGAPINEAASLRIDRRLPGSAALSAPTDSLSSSIFGITRLQQQAPGLNQPPRDPTSSLDNPKSVPWQELPPPTGLRDIQPSPVPSAAIDARIQPRKLAVPMRTIVDNQLDGNTADLISQRNLVWNDQNRVQSPAGPDGIGRAPARPTVPTDGLPDSDVFTDMQLAMQLRENPNADWYAEMRKGRDGNQAPTGTEIRSDQADAQAEATEYVDRVLNSRVETFVGKGETPLNDTLLKAESLLQIGQYYDAARQYDRAYQMAPANPLPLIGKAYALLASGEYSSAADSLLRGLDRFPEISRFDIDLTALLGGGEVVDIRRADIMRILERNDDSRLRFLLGYIEYHTGSKQRGLEDLDRAAAASDANSMMHRYPRLLRGDGVQNESPDAAPANEKE